MLGEIIRKYGFWTFDFLKGSPIRKHYNEIKYINSGGEKSNDIVQENINKLLHYAVNNTEFYKEHRYFTSIKDFPVIDKNTIKNNGNPPEK